MSAAPVDEKKDSEIYAPLLRRIAYALEVIAATIARTGGLSGAAKTQEFGDIVEPNNWGGSYCAACGCQLLTEDVINDGKCPACLAGLVDYHE